MNLDETFSIDVYTDTLKHLSASRLRQAAAPLSLRGRVRGEPYFPPRQAHQDWWARESRGCPGGKLSSKEPAISQGLATAGPRPSASALLAGKAPDGPTAQVRDRRTSAVTARRVAVRARPPSSSASPLPTDPLRFSSSLTAGGRKRAANQGERSGCGSEDRIHCWMNLPPVGGGYKYLTTKPGCPPLRASARLRLGGGGAV